MIETPDSDNSDTADKTGKDGGESLLTGWSDHLFGTMMGCGSFAMFLWIAWEFDGSLLGVAGLLFYGGITLVLWIPGLFLISALILPRSVVLGIRDRALVVAVYMGGVPAVVGAVLILVCIVMGLTEGEESRRAVWREDKNKVVRVVVPDANTLGTRRVPKLDEIFRDAEPGKDFTISLIDDGAKVGRLQVLFPGKVVIRRGFVTFRGVNGHMKCLPGGLVQGERWEAEAYERPGVPCIVLWRTEGARLDYLTVSDHVASAKTPREARPLTGWLFGGTEILFLGLRVKISEGFEGEIGDWSVWTTSAIFPDLMPDANTYTPQLNGLVPKGPESEGPGSP